MGTERRQLRALTTAESMRLLASVSFGRVVFSRKALPAIRPVNHLVENGAVIIRAHLGAAMLTSAGLVVAYQADAIDPETHLGWSVTVTGVARQVTEPDDVVRYEQLLQPWVIGDTHQVIRIHPDIVTGYELIDGVDG